MAIDMYDLNDWWLKTCMMQMTSDDVLSSGYKYVSFAWWVSMYMHVMTSNYVYALMISSYVYAVIIYMH